MTSIEVIPVNKDDTVQTLIEKTRETSASRVVLFSDTRLPFLRNEINLRLLKFYSEEEGKNLTLVIKDRAVKKIARRLGIRIDDSVQQRERPVTGYAPLPAKLDGSVRGAASAEDRQPVRPYSSSPGGKLAVALLLTFFTLLAGLWFLLTPRLTLIIHPVVKEWTFSIRGEAGIGFTERDILNNQLPIRLLERQGEVSFSQPTSGKRAVGFLPARGPVVFINSSPNPVLVPKGVVVSAETGQRYATTANLMVPGKITKYEVGVATGEEYGRAEIEVEALEKGAGGNVGAKTILRIEGPLAKTLQVINFQRFTSGEDRWIAVADDKDFLRAKEEAERQMRFQAEEDLREMVEKDYILLPDLVFIETERINSDPPVGGEGEILNLRLIYRLRAGVLGTSSLYRWLRRHLQPTIPPGFVQLGEEIAIRDLQIHGNDLRHSEIYVHSAVKIRGRIDRRRLFQAIAGKTLEEAQIELAGFPEISRVEFKDTSGVRTIPTRSFQVRILTPAGR